jgi:hypothetical protein
MPIVLFLSALVAAQQGNTVLLLAGTDWVPIDLTGISEFVSNGRRLLQTEVTILAIAIDGDGRVWLLPSTG